MRRPQSSILHFDRVTPCIVPVTNALKWDEHTSDGAGCAMTAMLIAGVSRFAVTARICFQITNIIREHLGDLRTGPPMPAIMQIAVACATVTDWKTGKVTQSGIAEDVCHRCPRRSAAFGAAAAGSASLTEGRGVGSCLTRHSPGTAPL